MICDLQNLEYFTDYFLSNFSYEERGQEEKNYSSNSVHSP